MKTISKKYLALFMLIALVLFNACKKEDDIAVNPPNTPTTANVVLDLFKSNLDNERQITSVDITSGAYIWGNKGGSIYISPCSFLDENGNSVSGVIEFELIEAQTNLDMLKLNRPTFTKDGQLLVSGGVVYVNATQNGISLQINPDCSLHANIPSAGGTTDPKPMEYFVGSEDENGVFAWKQEISDTVTTILEDTPNSGGVTYGFPIDSVGWINCDYFYGLDGELTGVQLELPTGYDGSNTQGFIYYSSINSLAGLYDQDQAGVFDLGSGYETPVGLSVKFIALSGDSVNDYYYHITNNTATTMNHYEVISTMTGPVTYADLEIILNTNL
tara:strand:- start:136 stop:1125 length:990 start_codon:yes stop_codon:yes gene_type:complete